jgi:hypothetical protein
MKNPLYFAALLFFAVFALASAAKEKQHLPLPAPVLVARTVYIDNQTGIAKLGDRAYEQLKKWGRFQIVTDRREANLILLLTANEYTGGYVTTGGGQTGTVDSGGNIDTSGKPTYTTRVTVGYTFLTVIDPKTGDNYWSDSKRWGNLYTGFRSATKGLIDELRKRVEEQLKQSASEAKKPRDR